MKANYLDNSPAPKKSWHRWSWLIGPLIVQTLSAWEFRSLQVKISEQPRWEDGVSVRSWRMGRRYKVGPSKFRGQCNNVEAWFKAHTVEWFWDHFLVWFKSLVPCLALESRSLINKILGFRDLGIGPTHGNSPRLEKVGSWASEGMTSMLTLISLPLHFGLEISNCGMGIIKLAFPHSRDCEDYIRYPQGTIYSAIQTRAVFKLVSCSPIFRKGGFFLHLQKSIPSSPNILGGLLRNCPHQTESWDIDEPALKLGNGPRAGWWRREGISPGHSPHSSGSRDQWCWAKVKMTVRASWLTLALWGICILAKTF